MMMAAVVVAAVVAVVATTMMMTATEGTATTRMATMKITPVMEDVIRNDDHRSLRDDQHLGPRTLFSNSSQVLIRKTERPVRARSKGKIYDRP